MSNFYRKDEKMNAAEQRLVNLATQALATRQRIADMGEALIKLEQSELVVCEVDVLDDRGDTMAVVSMTKGEAIERLKARIGVAMTRSDQEQAEVQRACAALGDSNG